LWHHESRLLLLLLGHHLCGRLLLLLLLQCLLLLLLLLQCELLLELLLLHLHQCVVVVLHHNLHGMCHVVTSLRQTSPRAACVAALPWPWGWGWHTAMCTTTTAVTPRCCCCWVAAAAASAWEAVARCLSHDHHLCLEFVFVLILNQEGVGGWQHQLLAQAAHVHAVNCGTHSTAQHGRHSSKAQQTNSCLSVIYIPDETDSHSTA
jgi:hypothetical protein